MTAAAPIDRISLRRLVTQSFAIFRRDFLLLMALAFLVRGAGMAAEDWLGTLTRGDLAARPTAAIIPWLAGFIPFALADGAIVWVALRRLSGRAPSLGGPKGLLMTAGVVLAVDLVENTPDVVQLMIPQALTAPFEPAYGVLVPIAGAFWLSLWLPALAVAIAERAGGPTSLGRSLGLTLGHRWILATLCLSLQALILAASVLASLVLVETGYGATPGWTVEFAGLPIWAFSSITQAVAYWELVRLKTGLAPAAVASVFD